MLKPDKEYYLPKDATEVTRKIVSFLSPSDQEIFFQQGGHIVENRLTETLHRIGAVPFSAVSLWLYKSDISPRFMIDLTHFIARERAHDQTSHLSVFAREPLNEVNRANLATEIGAYSYESSLPELSFNHEVRTSAAEKPRVSPLYEADFQTIMQINFGHHQPQIGSKRQSNEIFLGGTIAFVDPMHPK